MTTDLTSRIAEIMSGQRRVPPIPTLLIAIAVTALVVIPLTGRVGQADSDSPAADPDAIIVDLADSDPMPLDGAVVSGSALISVEDDAASGVSFALYAAGSQEPLLASQDLVGPSFFPLRTPSGVARPVDTTVLANGAHELFVTVVTPDGEQRTVVTFEVANP